FDQHRDDGVAVSARRLGFERHDAIDQPARRWATTTDALNFLDFARRDLFVGAYQFFAEFLAGPQADEFNFDFLVWYETGQPNHVIRHVNQLDLVAHVEHVSRTALGM